MSNVPFLSKVLEKFVLHQLCGHLLANNLSETFQSAYHAHHSTETALLDITNCLLGSADEGQVSFLTLLSLSAAFNTMDHSILLTRLHDVFVTSGKAFEWFLSYLSDRFQSCQHQWLSLFTKEASLWGSSGLCLWPNTLYFVYTATV